MFINISSNSPIICYLSEALVASINLITPRLCGTWIEIRSCNEGGRTWRAFRRAQLKCDAAACARSCLRDPTLTKSDKRPTKELPPAAVLPLSGRPGRGRNPAGDRRGNGRSWSRRTRATYANFSLCVPRRRFGRRSSAWPKASSTLRWSRSPRRLSRSGREVSIRRRIEIVTRRPCKN